MIDINPIQDGLFRDCSQMKLGAVITYLKKIKKKILDTWNTP